MDDGMSGWIYDIITYQISTYDQNRPSCRAYRCSCVRVSLSTPGI